MRKKILIWWPWDFLTRIILKLKWLQNSSEQVINFFYEICFSTQLKLSTRCKKTPKINFSHQKISVANTYVVIAMLHYDFKFGIH